MADYSFVPVRLIQSTLVAKWRVDLSGDAFSYTDLSLLSQRTVVKYVDIVGVHRNEANLFVVTRDRAFSLLHQPGKWDYDRLLESLLERVKHAYGYA